MKKYTSYIAFLLVVILAVAAIFHDRFKSRHRNVKYGNPSYEKLVKECRYYKTEDDFITVKLYMGRNDDRGTTWYSVTFEKPGKEETQIFASAGTPGIESIGLCEKEIKLMCGKGCINIPVDEIESKLEVPLVYYNGKEVKEGSLLSDKI
ncbi:MAG TPA: hypothetical protein P5120_08040 [Spirochaetota bacterium]|nr:hypothetical protein [Spirochaetota bacterium]HPF05178.1 hypothetical protein [Spirochaetota bacterium]HPJ41878.1 hypothetical protein [Spirochaetota bacterium]HPR38476.1 hypothetical protein [Spirochaetota bacterium]HRX47455.1 hypothetical protein [Spirochaetota bacterium]